ncbi:MAG: PDZ domain-containing protein [bacterium]|nr:PDZ domain-containing protein [bacterium]
MRISRMAVYSSRATRRLLALAGVVFLIPGLAAAQGIEVNTAPGHYAQMGDIVAAFGLAPRVVVNTADSATAMTLLCTVDASSAQRIAVLDREITSEEFDRCIANGIRPVGEAVALSGGEAQIVLSEADALAGGPLRQFFDFAVGWSDVAATPETPPAPSAPAGADVANTPAASPETWATKFGVLSHERDLHTWAVWQMTDRNGEITVRVFVDGLGGVVSGRSAYSGYWMRYGGRGDGWPEQPCAEPRADHLGGTSQIYGGIQLLFGEPTPPSNWSARYGVCDRAPAGGLAGTPVPADATPGWLGVTLQTVTDEIAESLGLTRTIGALVADVISPGPAQESGIEAGDVIWKLDGAEVADAGDLVKRLIGSLAGQTIELGLIRGGNATTIRVTLAGRPASPIAAATAPAAPPRPAVVLWDVPGGDGNEQIGIVGSLAVMPLSEITRGAFNISDGAVGVVVTARDENRASAESLKPGMLIVKIGETDVESLADFKAAFTAEAAEASQLLMRVTASNGGGARFVSLAADDLRTTDRFYVTAAGVSYNRGVGDFPVHFGLATAHLLAGLALGNSFAQDILTDRWRELDLTTREVVQRRLYDAGYYPGPVDGVFGAGTRRALESLQNSAGR